MTGYTKVFMSLLDSTVWLESKETRLVWVTMMLMAGKEGVVTSSIPGLANRARVSVKECEEALRVLKAPDSNEYARSHQEHEGRRIQEVEGGWFLFSHAKYRALMKRESDRDQNAIRQARFRRKRKFRPGPIGAEVACVKSVENGTPPPHDDSDYLPQPKQAINTSDDDYSWERESR